MLTAGPMMTTADLIILKISIRAVRAYNLLINSIQLCAEFKYEETTRLLFAAEFNRGLFFHECKYAPFIHRFGSSI